MPRHPFRSLFRSGALATALFLSAVVAHGQAPVPHQLFSPAVVADEAAFRSDILANAELRMRLVQLVPNAPNGGIDLSVPLEIELFPEVSFTVQLYPDTKTSAVKGLEVWKGRVADVRFDHLPHYTNTVFVLNRNTGRLVANMETGQGFFQVLPTAAKGVYRVRQVKGFGNELCRIKEQGMRPSGAGRSNCGSECNETDADGRYVVDVFAGYSESAALLAGDVEAHAQANLETVNTGLANSEVDTVYLRLVGTAVGGENPGIVTSVLDDAWGWFAPEIQALAPDLIALFQTPTNAPGSAGGWGSMPGRATVNGVEWATVFRHEAGHNSGGNHCFPDNGNYKNGYNNSHWRTHLCGNDVNFYSTPLLTDDMGLPLGDPDEADMVRNWAEMAHTMANYNMHRVPYFEGDTCAGLPCLPQHWGGPIEYIHHVQFNDLDNWQTNPGWACPDIPGYSDYTDLYTEVERGATHLLTVEATVSWEESTMRAWIDWNGDGILSAAELVMDRTGNSPWDEYVTVPTDAVLGPARMRIRLQYGFGGPVDPCLGSGYSSGESEDYTVMVAGTHVAVGEPVGDAIGALILYPNPASGSVVIELPASVQGPASVLFRDVTGRNLLTMLAAARAGRIEVDTSRLPGGAYTCEVHHAGGVLMARMLKL